MGQEMELKPKSIKREGDGLAIAWNDGVNSFVAFSKLRKQCPCASCMEERSKPADPFRILRPEEIAAGAPAPVAMNVRGYYAYQIVWNDGHDTGIYSIEYLRQLSDPVVAPK
jgi:DUF971 family protein